jgi:hypothetical protein
MYNTFTYRCCCFCCKCLPTINPEAGQEEKDHTYILIYISLYMYIFTIINMYMCVYIHMDINTNKCTFLHIQMLLFFLQVSVYNQPRGRARRKRYTIIHANLPIYLLLISIFGVFTYTLIHIHTSKYRCCCFCCKCLPTINPEAGQEEKDHTYRYKKMFLNTCRYIFINV